MLSLYELHETAKVKLQKYGSEIGDAMPEIWNAIQMDEKCFHEGIQRNTLILRQFKSSSIPFPKSNKILPPDELMELIDRSYISGEGGLFNTGHTIQRIDGTRCGFLKLPYTFWNLFLIFIVIFLLLALAISFTAGFYTWCPFLVECKKTAFFFVS
jgi:hypothetical protein